MAAFGPTINTLVDNAYNQTNHDFYTRFALQKGKPMCLAESGSPYHPNYGGVDELTLKQGKPATSPWALPIERSAEKS